MHDVEVAIVGAGIAGLSCALRCAQAGVSCTVVEATDAVGGRVRTDVIDGFVLDRGFQVFLTAYPEASDLLDYEMLDLRPFIPGADVFANGRFHRLADPRRRPIDALRVLPSPLTKMRDIPALLGLTLRWTPERLKIEEVPDVTTEEALRQAGLSPRVIDAFFRPFFGGVFFDRDLQTSARMLAFCFSMFASGVAAVPARGMQRIPEHLAAQLPAGSLHLECPVGAIEGEDLLLEGGARVRARQVVVATEGDTAAKLLGDADLAPAWRSTRTLWFVAAGPPSEEPILMLNGEGRGLVNHLAVLTNASPMYGPDTRGLIAANVVDQHCPEGEELERLVRKQLERWFGAVVETWDLLRTDVIEHALPDQLVRRNRSVLSDWRRPVELGDHHPIVCGDHRDNASIDGAMVSGRRAAEAAIARLRA